jgi:hypothetical protein
MLEEIFGSSELEFREIKENVGRDTQLEINL